MQQQKAPTTLYQLAQRLENHTRRKPILEGLMMFLVVSFSVLVAFFNLSNSTNIQVFLVKLGFILLSLLVVTFVIRSLSGHGVLLGKLRVSLETTTRAELPALLRVLRALDENRFSAGKQERRLRRSALSLLGHFLARIPKDELSALTEQDRDYLVRELRWRLRHTRRAKPHDIELSIRLFLALAELKHPGAEDIAHRALRHLEPRLRLSAQTYLNYAKTV